MFFKTGMSEQKKTNRHKPIVENCAKHGQTNGLKMNGVVLLCRQDIFKFWTLKFRSRERRMDKCFQSQKNHAASQPRVRAADAVFRGTGVTYVACTVTLLTCNQVQLPHAALPAHGTPLSRVVGVKICRWRCSASA